MTRSEVTMNRVAILALACLLTGATHASAQDAANNPEAFALMPSAYAQFDFRAFPDWTVEPGEGRMARDTVAATIDPEYSAPVESRSGSTGTSSSVRR